MAKFAIIKFIYSEKATKFCEIFILLLSYVVPFKSKVVISQNFVASSECLSFTRMLHTLTPLINEHAHLFFWRNRFHPTRWFSCDRLKISILPASIWLDSTTGRVDFSSYSFIREVRVWTSMKFGADSILDQICILINEINKDSYALMLFALCNIM